MLFCLEVQMLWSLDLLLSLGLLDMVVLMSLVLFPPVQVQRSKFKR
jgi:hypothetical protein